MGRPKGSKNKQKLHLVGEPVAATKKLTPAMQMRIHRRRVALWTGAGLSPEEIAAAMEIDVEKLKVIFARELEHGYAIARAERLAKLDDADNVAADKRLLDEIVCAPPFSDPRLASRKASKIGKKEAADAAAQGAEQGTSWDDLFRAPARPN